MRKFTNDWFTPRIPGWERILQEIKGKPLDALEVGCYEGMATLWLLDNVLTHPQSHITVIDTFAGSKEHREGIHKTSFQFTEKLFVENTKQFSNKLTIVKGLSQDALRKITGTFDLIYIDGSHETQDVLTDAVLAWLLLRPNGIMIFDDYDFPDVALAVDIFLHVWKGTYLELGSGGQIAMSKL